MVPVDKQEAGLQETISGKDGLQQLLNRMKCVGTEFVILMGNLGILGLEGIPELIQSKFQTFFKPQSLLQMKFDTETDTEERPKPSFSVCEVWELYLRPIGGTPGASWSTI